MQRILAAVDGSPNSNHAVDVASEVARPIGATLVLVHVSEPIRLSREHYGAFVAQIEERRAHEAEKTLRDAWRQAEKQNVKAEIRSITGPVAESIADLAEAEKADLVVVGNRGLGGVARVLLGSVSDRLVHICKVPVLVAH